DSSQRGGYVPLTAENLRQLGTIRSVQTSNFGKSGNTTIQITTRIEENEEIQHALKEASVIVVSAGGNDLIHSIRESGLQIDLPQAEKARQQYQEHLRGMIDEIRTLNSSAPLFIFGIYNPYEKELEQLTYLQTTVSEWNRTTEELAEKEKNVYFV